MTSKQTIDDPTPDDPSVDPDTDAAQAEQILATAVPQSTTDAELIDADKAILDAEEQLIDPPSPVVASTEPHYDQETGAFV